MAPGPRNPLEYKRHSPTPDENRVSTLLESPPPRPWRAFNQNSRNRSNLAINEGAARAVAPLWQFNFRAFHAINAPICTRSSQ